MFEEEVYGPDDELPDWAFEDEHGVPDDVDLGPDENPGLEAPLTGEPGVPV